MKKRRLIICMAAVLLLSGCGAPASKADDSKSRESETAAAAEGEETVEEITMTNKEKELLSAVFSNGDMIREGQLFGYEETALAELRAGEEYMKAKYPEYSFEITSIEPANKFYPWMTVHLDNPEYGSCIAVVTPVEEGYTFTEDFYGKILRKRYDEKIGALLKEAGVTAVSCTDFFSPMGEEVGEDTSPEDMIALKSGLPRNTRLYVEDASDRDAETEKVRGILADAGIYGSYTLYFVPDGPEEDAEILEGARAAFEHRTFNCFDVQ